MNDRIKNAFEGIRAEDHLKKNTLSFLRSNMQKGQQRRNRSILKPLAVAFSCFLMLAIGGVGGIFSYNAYFTETMYVDVDINPSIELTLNRFERVIGVYAYNDDGEKLLAQLDLTHKLYDSAVTVLTEAAIQNGFLSEGGLVSVTLQSVGEADEEIMLETLQTNISSTVNEHHASSVMIDVFPVDSDTREYAHDQNLSPAKYISIKELQEVDPTATVEGCRGRTITEIRERTESHSGGHHGSSDSDLPPPESAPDTVTEEAQIEEAVDPPAESSHGNGHHRRRGHR